MLLYNWFGYRALSYYLQARSDIRIEQQLDLHQYNEQDLVEIRIPLHMPYISNTGSFERCDGQVEVNGRHYAYVKRKVENGSLVLLCLRNESRKKISDARNNYFRLVNDLGAASHQQKSSPSFFKSLLTEYRPEQNNWSIPSLTPYQHAPVGSYLLYCPAAEPNNPEYPPERG